MSEREKYIQKMKAKLEEWNADIAKLEKKADAAEAELKQKYHQQIVRLRAQREEAAAKLHELQGAGDSAWQDLKAGVEMAWDALGEAVDSAFKRFK